MERQVDSRNIKWLTQYLCCLFAEVAEILFPGTMFQDVLTFKISALHHFDFRSQYNSSGWISNFSEIEWFPWLSLYNSESTSDGELIFWMCKHLEKMCLETKFQPFLFINKRDIGWATWRSCDPLDVPPTVQAYYYLSCSIFCCSLRWKPSFHCQIEFCSICWHQSSYHKHLCPEILYHLCQ